MAVADARIIRACTGLMVLAIAATTLLALPQVGGGGGNPFDAVELRELIEEIESGEAEDRAEAVAEEPGLTPMATPCFMRRPRLALGVNQSWRHRFAAATLMSDPTQRLVLLDELLASAPDDTTRWRIDIAMFESALRLGDAGSNEYLQRAARRVVPDSCRSDEAYLAAAIAGTPRDAAELLANAVQKDPGFWNAHERLALLSAAGTGSDPASCETDAIRTLESVVQLAALAQRDTQFQRINRAMEAMPRNGRTALLRGMILHQTGEPAAAREAYEQGLASLGQSACDDIQRQGLQGVLATMEVAE